MTETSGNLALKKESASKFTLPALRTRFSSAGNARCIVVLGQKRLFAPTNLHLYHYAGNNPVKYTDPTGKAEKDYRIGSSNDFKFDKFGIQILFHYLFGGGKELDVSSKAWGNYMRSNQDLTNQINASIIDQAAYLDSESGSTKSFSFQIHAEVENGESITGINYLHGSNASVGDLQI